ncbi:hypothetical protein KY346_05995 [Candidatus Woesearchaeota archaeon]|nr:hypothetical protein [Candidatus Woesearchaeota archaeon]
MKKTIRVSAVDSSLADKIAEALKDTHYDIQPVSEGTNLLDSGIIITDNLEFLDDERLKNNLKTPVLYVSDKKIDAGLVPEKNIFRAVFPDSDLNSMTGAPAKEHPVQNKQLTEIVNFLMKASNTIDTFELLLYSDSFEQKLGDEQHYTEQGDYGTEEQPQTELFKIRGVPRKISRVEAAYQAIEVFKLLDETSRQANGTAHSKILFMSQDNERMNKYAKFLHSMTGAMVEIYNKLDGDLIDELESGNYALIIYDGEQIRPGDQAVLRDLEELVNAAWSNKIEVLTMCSPAKAMQLMSDSKLSYKAHNFLFSENPDHRQFLESVQHVLEVQSGRTLINMLDRPDLALVSNAVENLLKTEDLAAVERGLDQIRTALAFKMGLKFDELEKLDKLATDKLFSTTPLKLPELGYLLKFFTDERRARCEIIALDYLQDYDKTRQMKMEEARKGLLMKKEDLYWRHMPKINTRKTATAHGKILIGEYIFGPTLRDLAPEIGERLAADDKKARDFRNAALFEMNKYCAFFQVVAAKKLPELMGDMLIEKTAFKKDFKKIIENIKTLGLPISSAEYRCADMCAEIFDLNISDPDSTQYFDFYWDNVILETGNDSDSFDEVLEKCEASGKEPRKFIEDIIHRIDFNKIYRYTSKTEDPSRFAVKNFMRAAPRNKREREQIENDRKQFYKHLLMYSKKFQLLEELSSSKDPVYDDFEKQITQLDFWIERMENKPWLLKEKDHAEINEMLGIKEKNDFFYTERYVTLYRTARHTILLFNSIKDRNRKLEEEILTQEQFEEDVDFIEKDFRETYKQATIILEKIIEDKKDCLKRRNINIDDYKLLVSEANKELTAEHADEFKEYLKDAKRMEDSGERNALFTYVAANYLNAFFRKVHKGKFNLYKIQ